MPQHIVQQGEYLGRIVARHGHRDWKRVWEASENADLREKRQNPNVLYPGDRVFVPEFETAERPGATQQRHRFQVKGSIPKLIIEFRDIGNQPITNAECELRLSTGPVSLTTDSQGRIEQLICTEDEIATLAFRDREIPFPPEIPVMIGHLDPVDQVSGQIARLNNLGYVAGTLPIQTGSPEDERSKAAQLKSAIEEFQCDQKLQVDGLCGPATQKKLKEVHGC